MNRVDLTHIPDEVDRLEVGPEMFLVWDAEHRVYFQHPCEIIPEETGGGMLQKITAPMLDVRHRIVSTHDGDGHVASATVRPSILCPACGTHGFVTEGVWR